MFTQKTDRATARTSPAAVRPRPGLSGNRSGQSVVLLAVALLTLMGMAALAIDLGYLHQLRAHLQMIADASSLAAAQELPDQTAVTNRATQYAYFNDSTHGTIVAGTDVTVGNWNAVTGAFTPAAMPLNAVRVVARRAGQNGNPAPLFFARVFGLEVAHVGASAIATAGALGTLSRFLIDAEMIDSDIPAIESLAASLGKDKEWIISDNNGDWFIDLPPGTTLELPTGQVGDAGLFDVTAGGFPFGQGTDPSYEDFLNYNEDSNSWRYDLIPKEMLDPLTGVVAVEDPSLYPSFVDPENCQVSPIFKSDVNVLNGPANVNALGWRRGLLAFKIKAVGTDPDGNGSVLPNLVIEVCDPALYTGPGGLDNVGPWADERIRLVK